MDSKTEKVSDGIIVLGMHRSGTSALTGMLHHLGCALGNRIMPAEKGVNEKGFWENDDIVRINEEILSEIRRSWDDPRLYPDEWWESEKILDYSNEIYELIENELLIHPIWCIKDPRICRLLPLWKNIL